MKMIYEEDEYPIKVGDRVRHYKGWSGIVTKIDRMFQHPTECSIKRDESEEIVSTWTDFVKKIEIIETTNTED